MSKQPTIGGVSVEKWYKLVDKSLMHTGVVVSNLQVQGEC